MSDQRPPISKPMLAEKIRYANRAIIASTSGDGPKLANGATMNGDAASSDTRTEPVNHRMPKERRWSSNQSPEKMPDAIHRRRLYRPRDRSIRGFTGRTRKISYF